MKLYNAGFLAVFSILTADPNVKAWTQLFSDGVIYEEESRCLGAIETEKERRSKIREQFQNPAGNQVPQNLESQGLSKVIIYDVSPVTGICLQIKP